MREARPKRWLGVAVIVLVLFAAAAGGGVALQSASRDVVAQPPAERADALQQLEADRAARDRAARDRRDRAARERRDRAASRRSEQKSTRPARLRPLRRGDGYAVPGGSGRVRKLQRALRRLDLVPRMVASRTPGRRVRLIATGEFGPVTERGVRRFQRRSGLPVTGVADARTLARIYAAAAQGRKR